MKRIIASKRTHHEDLGDDKIKQSHYSNEDDDDYDDDDDEHRMQVCSGCDRAICLACHELEGGDEPALMECEYCEAPDDEYCVDCRGTCKFCSTVVCPNCLLQCGHCGIVLCPRDGKFAVECWNCHVPYCLVCLATLSSSSTGCPQCHAKPSKKMSQLVHLRLKSIYRAFQQQQKQTGDTKPRSRASQKSTTTASTTTTTTSSSKHATHVSVKSSFGTGSAKLGTSIVMKRNAEGTWDVEETTEGGKTVKQSLDDWQKGKKTSQDSTTQEEEQADAAAAELLAQLEQEQVKVEKKKKRKKRKKKRTNSMAAQSDDDEDLQKSEDAFGDGADQKEALVLQNYLCDPENDDDTRSSEPPVDNTLDPEHDDEDLHFLSSKAPTSQQTLSGTQDDDDDDDDETRVNQLIADGDQRGLEKLLLELKGVPGKAGLRKSAKKALKRLAAAATEEDGTAEAEDEEEEVAVGEQLKAVEDMPLIKMISRNVQDAASTSAHGSKRSLGGSNGPGAECVLHMAPNLVGWVIGKGGTRIRDLMDDTGARIWIDQESMGPNEPRIVYVSASKMSTVDRAIASLRELVERAPVNFSRTSSLGAQSRSTPVQNEQSKAVSAKPPDSGIKEASEIITCDARYVPLLIGRRGWTIKNIQDSSGARIDIDQTVTPRKITISGEPDHVKHATRMVNDVLSYPDARLHPQGEKGNSIISNKSPPTGIGGEPSKTQGDVSVSASGHTGAVPEVLSSPDIAVVTNGGDSDIPAGQSSSWNADVTRSAVNEKFISSSECTHPADFLVGQRDPEICIAVGEGVVGQPMLSRQGSDEHLCKAVGTGVMGQQMLSQQDNGPIVGTIGGGVPSRKAPNELPYILAPDGPGVGLSMHQKQGPSVSGLGTVLDAGDVSVSSASLRSGQHGLFDRVEQLSYQNELSTPSSLQHPLNMHGNHPGNQRADLVSGAGTGVGYLSNLLGFGDSVLDDVGQECRILTAVHHELGPSLEREQERLQGNHSLGFDRDLLQETARIRLAGERSIQADSLTPHRDDSDLVDSLFAPASAGGQEMFVNGFEGLSIRRGELASGNFVLDGTDTSSDDGAKLGSAMF